MQVGDIVECRCIYIIVGYSEIGNAIGVNLDRDGLEICRSYFSDEHHSQLIRGHLTLEQMFTHPSVVIREVAETIWK